MDWILEEVIDNMNARVEALRKATLEQDIPLAYLSAMANEIRWIKVQLKEIEDMKQEEVRDFEYAEEDLREKKADTCI